MPASQTQKHLVRQAIFQVAEDLEAPTYMLLAQAKIESDYDDQAYNATSGALGPFQIRPATGQAPGFGTKPIAFADMTDPGKATEFAGEYLVGLRADPSVGKGLWSLALLHYNVGPWADTSTASGPYKALASLVASLEGETLSFKLMPESQA